MDLNEKLADSVRVLRDEHFPRTDSIRFELSRLSLQVVEELFAPSPDTARARALVDQIGRRQAAMEWLIFDHFNEIKKICLPEYHERLKLLILGAIQAKQPPPGAGQRDGRLPPPGEHRPPPPEGDRRPTPQGDRRPPGP